MLGGALDLGDFLLPAPPAAGVHGDPGVGAGPPGGMPGPELHGGAAGDAALADPGPEPPVVDEEAPAKQLQFKRRGPELMSHARAAKAAKLAKKKEELLQQKAEAAQQVLDTVVRSLPIAGKLIGKASASTAVGKLKKNLKPSDLKIVTRGVHLPPKVGANLGVKQKRLICAGAKMVLLRQRLAFK